MRDSESFNERLLTGQLGKIHLSASRNQSVLICKGKEREKKGREASKGKSPWLLACCPGCESIYVPS